ncbi:MAG: preprotein translocase subunit SecY [Symbiobacteriaceae bacterium]|nr:preprotein translocase subunit SecY [Symbiobacteriaceae bacterium]
MFATLANAWKIIELRKKILFTLLLLVIYRIGAHIPTPSFNPAAVSGIFNSSTDLLGFLNVMSGGALGNMSLFALGVGPYITSSIIIQLLTMVIPSWEEMQKEGGQEVQRKFQEYTRYGTVVLAMLQGYATAYGLNAQYPGTVLNPSMATYSLIAISWTAGAVLLMWLGEYMSDRGVGSGISIIIYAGIISRLPSAVISIIQSMMSGETAFWQPILLIIAAAATIAGVVFITEGVRRIPVQYAKRTVGRRVYGGQATHIPFKVNQAGVLPVIFASSLLMFPGTILSFINQNWAASFNEAFKWGSFWHTVVYLLLILFFSYFYTAMQFNPVDVSKNMQKNGGFVPGIRPGRPTSDYLTRIMDRLTLTGAIFLCGLVVLPNLLMVLTGIESGFGGTAILIAVGVALETMKQIESQVTERWYTGFLG